MSWTGWHPNMLIYNCFVTVLRDVLRPQRGNAQTGEFFFFYFNYNTLVTYFFFFHLFTSCCRCVITPRNLKQFIPFRAPSVRVFFFFFNPVTTVQISGKGSLKPSSYRINISFCTKRRGGGRTDGGHAGKELLYIIIYIVYIQRERRISLSFFFFTTPAVIRCKFISAE